MARIVSLPNPGTEGRPKFLNSDDPMLINNFIDAETRAGHGIFDILNPLKPGVTVHGKDNIAAIEFMFFDIDGKNVVESMEEIDALLATKVPLKPTMLHDSGHGRHVIYRLKERVAEGDPDYAELCAMHAQLVDYFGADPAVQPWSLLRRPGTLNNKREPFVPCRALSIAALVDLTEMKDFVELVGDAAPLTTRKSKPITDGHDADRHIAAHDGPVDVEAQLAAMRHGAGDNSVNKTQSSVIPALLWRGTHPDEVVEQVVNATMVMAERQGLNWKRDLENNTVRSRCNSALRNLMLKDYDYTTGTIPSWLTAEFHAPWMEALKAGRRPDIGLNRVGFYVRSWKPKANEKKAKQPTSELPKVETRREETQHKFRFKLVSFCDLRPGPEPLYLVDEVIPVAGLVDVWGKAKCYKSFWCLDLMLHVAMGWEYRDRYVQQGAVVYCAFEGAHGYKKRVEALRRHYNIEDATPVPLHVMPGQANLITDHPALIKEISEQLGDIRPVAVVLDTLNKSLVGSENKDTDMGAYVRAAEAIRDAFTCVVIIVHHCGYDDTRPRGHSSLPGAVDAQLAVTRTEDVITVTVEMMRDGPEETQVVSAVEPIEVGQDQNGKVLTSLVVVPSDADAYNREHRSWPRGLSVFHTALKASLATKGETFQPEAGVLPVRAVDQWHIRDRFYATYAEDEKDTTKRQANLQKAFVRALAEAQKRGVIKVMRSAGGQTMLWLQTRGENL